MERKMMMMMKKKPSKPLCEECLQIVQMAKPVDTTFLDVANGKRHREHPHVGAVDSDGNAGYVHDETSLRRHPPPFRFRALRRQCLERDDEYEMLTKKVYVVDFPNTTNDGDNNNSNNDTQATTTTREAGERTGPRRAKIFCAVYTIDSAHHKIQAIRETWGYVLLLPGMLFS
jgi:hypothetical protein